MAKLKLCGLPTTLYFHYEIYQAPKSWAEKAYPELIYYNRLPKGGHFEAWERPELFIEEIRGGVATCRARGLVG